MIQPGQIGFSICEKSWFGKFIKFFTKSDFSHTFICYYPLQDLELIFEANELMMLTPFDKHYRNNVGQKYEVWEITQFSGDAITTLMTVDALKACYLEYCNVKYGYTQLLWFIWRWLAESLGIKLDLKKDRKWFVKGILCSELVYLYLRTLNIPILNAELDLYCANNITPKDLREIFLRHPEIFILMEKK
jgi:hypothetical protein